MSGPDKINIARTIAEARREVAAARSGGKRIGLVPTMGALHDGHLCLIDLCRKHADFVGVSIFVNPTQFGPNEDFQSYPRNFDRDRLLVEGRRADLIFAPEAGEIYRTKTRIRFELERLGDRLCGASRPRHFAGVLQVVTKLFHIVQPDVAVFGQKDLQQLVIIKRLVGEYDFPVEVVSAPTVREPDGLAMSSRNAYLSADEREQAPVLHRALQHGLRLITTGERSSAAVVSGMSVFIKSEAPGAKIDYIEIVDAAELQTTEQCKGLCAITLAVFIGKTRLIDNLVLEVKGSNVQVIPALS